MKMRNKIVMVTKRGFFECLKSDNFGAIVTYSL
jgi:hypothetical protein